MVAYIPKNATAVTESVTVAIDGFGSQTEQVAQGKVFVDGCLPEVDGKISLIPIGEDSVITIYEGLRILDACETEDGPIHTDYGPSQEVYARGLFIKVFNQDCYNQRWLKIQLLKDIQAFMETNPEGGYCQTCVGLKFLKPTKKLVEQNQSQFKAPRIKR